MKDETKELLELVDALRDRGVSHLNVSIGEVRLECTVTPKMPDELPTTQAERERLLNDPRTPSSIKERITLEDEKDLYG